MRVGVHNFGRYVPKDLVRRLIDAGGVPMLGGERRELTIMFSDIAGFTTQSEQTPPEQLMRSISTYFDRMAEVLHAHQGVIDKFIGDAIMALWNAPAPDPEHVRNACRGVLACRGANLELNAALAAKGLPPLATRFGLHTGETVVGNVGGADRIQYTALGANVNLAARLEALNKYYRTTILVSEDTRRRAGRDSCSDSSLWRSLPGRANLSRCTNWSGRATTPKRKRLPNCARGGRTRSSISTPATSPRHSRRPALRTGSPPSITDESRHT
jgi:adenylate cyclase